MNSEPKEHCDDNSDQDQVSDQDKVSDQDQDSDQDNVSDGDCKQDLNSKDLGKVEKKYKPKRYTIPKYDHTSILQTVRDFDTAMNNENDLNSYKKLITELILEGNIDHMLFVKYKCYLKSIPEALAIIKGFFHKLIVDDRRYDIISVYNELFCDEVYKVIDKYNERYVIPQDILNKALDDYNKKIASFIKKTHTLYKMKTFTEGQIIGAQDREGRWWLSQVITMVTYGQHRCYYVRFCGWDECFNEWIADPYRLQWYNYKRHKLYRKKATIN